MLTLCLHFVGDWVRLHFNFNKHQFTCTRIDYIVIYPRLTIVGLSPSQSRPNLITIGFYNQQFTIRLRHYHIVPLMHVWCRLGT